jgi:hypothetical protein
VEFAGKEMTAEEVLEEVLRDEAFYETSKGGITIRGVNRFYNLTFFSGSLSLPAFSVCMYASKSSFVASEYSDALGKPAFA